MAIVTTNGRANRMANYIVKPSLVYDAHVTRIIDSPSPTAMAVLLERVDNGELGVLCQLQLEMERKSDVFAGIVQTRRNALTSLEWCIEPDPKADEDDAFAQEVADYVSDELTSLDSWEEALAHLPTAIGPNLAVLELVWEKFRLADTVIVPHTRLATHPITNRGVAIRTDDNYAGYPVEDFPNKFVVYVPNSRGGFPFTSTLTHASIRAYLMAYHSTVDWMAFSELFGCPIRDLMYPDAIKPSDLETLKKAVNEGGSDVAITRPEGSELNFIQAAGTGETYKRQLEHTNASMSILWLGQTLTTDVGDSGSRALGDVHNEVRHDVRDSDLQSEAAAIRRQVIRPMVAMKYPGRDAPIPIFKRKVYEARDVESERLTLDQLKLAQTEKLTVGSAWLYEALNIPKPPVGELPETITLGAVATPTIGTAPDQVPLPDEGENPNG